MNDEVEEVIVEEVDAEKSTEQQRETDRGKKNIQQQMQKSYQNRREKPESGRNKKRD